MLTVLISALSFHEEPLERASLHEAPLLDELHEVDLQALSRLSFAADIFGLQTLESAMSESMTRFRLMILQVTVDESARCLAFGLDI